MKRVLMIFVVVVVLFITILSGCVSFAKACGWIDMDNVELGMMFSEVMEHGPNPQDILISERDGLRVTICRYEIATLIFVNGRLGEIIY